MLLGVSAVGGVVEVVHAVRRGRVRRRKIEGIVLEGGIEIDGIPWYGALEGRKGLLRVKPRFF